MLNIPTFGATRLALLVVLGAAVGWTASPALAVCFRSESIQCREDFEAFRAVASVRNGFAAAGQVKTGSPSGLALLRLSRAGKAEAQQPVPIPWPPNLLTNTAPIAEAKKLVALPNGGLVLISNIQLRGSAAQNVGWVAGIGADGRMIWHRVLGETSADTFLYGAHYDARADRVIVVGKRQAGGDDRSCANWSQSFVQGLRAADGLLTEPSVTHGPQQPGPKNRQGLYDIVAGEGPGAFVVTGFQTRPQTGGGCQDEMLVGTLRESGSGTSASGAWTLSVRGLGTGDADEVAFAIKPAGRGRYLVAGHGQHPGTGARAAQARFVRLTPFQIEQSVSFPFPESGSDRKGGDRFRAVIPVANGSRFVLAGSVSNGASGVNLAMWRVASADLSQMEPPMIFDEPGGSDIFDGAASPDGRVLLVGRGADRDGTQMGWFGFVGGRLAAKPQLNPRPLGSGSQGLKRLTALLNGEGGYRLPETATSAPSSYFHEQVAEGLQLDISLPVPAPRAVRISAQAASGDVDLLLTDASGRLVTFSNYSGSATEFVIRQLEIGRYTISLIAQSALRDLVIRVGPAQEITAPALSQLQTLSPEDRIKLSEQLVAAGYLPSPEPSIGFGGETARATLAAQENSRRAFGPRGIGAALAKQVGLSPTR